ncbi:MAG: hypothetical protein KDK12_16035 [Rhodobacteraceae bacterium]|nr:hypothetical protein [Paracoccaceae bacterium]
MLRLLLLAAAVAAPVSATATTYWARSNAPVFADQTLTRPVAILARCSRVDRPVIASGVARLRGGGYTPARNLMGDAGHCADASRLAGLAPRPAHRR